MNWTDGIVASFRVAALVLLVAGCSDSRLKGMQKVFPVEGDLSYQGKPMSWAMITFVPVESAGKNPINPHATADEKGHYRMTTYYTSDGAPAGEYRVRIYWPTSRVDDSRPDADDSLPPDQLDMAYADEKEPKLHATVQDKKNAIDFKLP